MSHIRFAAEAMRFRISTVRHPLVGEESIDLEALARAAVCAGDPEVDSALRRIGTAWIQAGFDAEAMFQPWAEERIESFFADRPDLVDALDDIWRVATQPMIAA